MYNRETITHLTKLIGGNDESRQWLLKNNFTELVLLHYAIGGYDKALKELSDKKYYEVAAFAHALQGDVKAFHWLAENKKFIWAATLNVINKKKDAELWLRRYKLDYYVELAITIRNEIESADKGDIFAWFGRLIRKKH